MLDSAHLWYRLDRCRDDTVLVTVTASGERLEIDVFEDGNVEFSRFQGSEAVEGGLDEVERLIRQLADDSK